MIDANKSDHGTLHTPLTNSFLQCLEAAPNEEKTLFLAFLQAWKKYLAIRRVIPVPTVALAAVEVFGKFFVQNYRLLCSRGSNS